MAGNSKGNIILTARGDLLNLLNQRALGYGELFLATKAYSTSQMATSGKIIYDISGGKQIQIKRIDQGDLFAGSNTKNKVYCLGGGSSLKWGGLSFATNWDLAKSEAKENPNRIYMYVGNTSLNSDAQMAQKAGASDEAEIKDKYIAEASKEYRDDINPGDIFFYNPQMEQLVILHLNHSSDALTKIAVDQLISNSMRNLLSSGEGTLKDFLDGPARHFQYLESTYGWVPLTKTDAVKVTKAESSDLHTWDIQFSSNVSEYFKDGEVFYIPFNKGLNKYTIRDAEGSTLLGLASGEVFYEGDLLIALPAEKNSTDFTMGSDTDADGISFAHISLYGGLVKQLIPGEIKRADDYATYLWKATSAQKNDSTFLTETDAEGNLLNGIKEYIERLYQTKVDIDPKTHKIISSQLPNYLLGSLKYMGTADKLFDGDLNDMPGDYSGSDLYKLLNTEKYKNFDSNEDSYDGSDSSGDVRTDSGNSADTKDTERRVGSYWVWQGETTKVTGLTNIFNFDEEKDDLWSEESESAGSDSLATLEDPNNTEKNRKNYNNSVEHVLNKGDWIVFGENEKFDIIDNTSNFVGLMVNGQILSGLVNIVDGDRTMNMRTWEEGPKIREVGKTLEIDAYQQDADTLKLSNPNSVLFKGGIIPTVDDTHLPLISSDGLAYSSRFGISENQQGFELGKRDGYQGTSFYFGRYTDAAKPETNDWYIKEYDIDSFFKNDDSINPENKVTVKFGDYYDESLDKERNFEGFNFGNFLFEENKSAADVYLFKIAYEETPELYLPSHSGILATENYVDYGFAVIKRVIDDLYLALDAKTLTGNEDWLQTIVEYEDKDGTTQKKIYDSKVKQDYTKGENLILRLYTVSKEDDATNSTGTYTRFGTLAKIPSNLNVKHDSVNPNYSGVGYAVDYYLGTDDPLPLNPSVPDGDVLNIFPNHSGMLLNDNSVIDGGEW